MAPVAARLQELLGSQIATVSDCIGPCVKTKVNSLADGDVLLLENVRFHAGEESNDPAFAKVTLIRSCFSLIDYYRVLLSEERERT